MGCRPDLLGAAPQTPLVASMKPVFYEFFAGGGMARAGLGDGWACGFANDFDRKKSEIYKLNWGGASLMVGDVGGVETRDLPGVADLAWASFPCQDLSLAGGGAGLRGERSGNFWPFWRLMQALRAEDRAPRAIVLENVCGTLTSHGGRDFSAISAAIADEGYQFGAVVIDAALFVPHSRPRLFIVAVRDVPPGLIAEQPSPPWHTKALCFAYEQLSGKTKESWVWWSLPLPAKRTVCFADLIEETPRDVSWHSESETNRLLSLMSAINLEKLDAAKNMGRRMVGTIYRRTRRDESGGKTQRAEVRFDDIAGCLRTPAGGSSRQLILVVEGQRVRSRLISSRETARLMGLPDEYALPDCYNDAYHLTGDGVVVPVVRHIARHLLDDIAAITPTPSVHHPNSWCRTAISSPVASSTAHPAE